MKTLKKTLCLVLAVVLALGVMVLPAYADKERYDSFEDKDDVSIKHEEAVGALTGVGAINGKRQTNGDNTVSPSEKITRAEAVTMLVRALLGSSASTLPKEDTKFDDVKKDHFASQYVAYAVANGITAGKSSKTFAPNDLVTGYELARMALVAANIKTNFTAAEWQVQTGPAADKAGLLVALEKIEDLNNPLTREQSAQLIWNMVTYVPETVKLDVAEVKDGNTTKKFEVTYPAETIGGKVYNLKAVYNYNEEDKNYDPNHLDWDEDYGYPSVKWSNAKTNEVYYAGPVGGLVSFTFGDGAASKLTVADLKTKLGITAAGGIDANVYYNGFGSTADNTLAATDDPATKKVTTNESDRGATVVIFKAPAWMNTKYAVYVNYMYAAYNNDAAETDPFNAVSTNTGTYVSGSINLGKIAAKTVVTFGYSKYKNTAVNKKTDGMYDGYAQITRRGNDSTNPYFYLTTSDKKTTKTYISAKAIYIGLDGTVQKLNYMPSSTTPPDTEKNYIEANGNRYYEVWTDGAGNVLVLKEINKKADPATTVTYDNFGYILEFTCKPGVYRDDMQLEKTEEAIARVLMVNVKTGETGIYELATNRADKATVWTTLGVDGKAEHGIEIKDEVECIGPAKEYSGSDQTILHGFVAYKKLAKGWAVTPVEQLNNISSTDQSYVVAESFNTTAKDGQVLITKKSDQTTVYAYGNNSSVVTLLNNPSEDGTRVTAYTAVLQANGYSELKHITTNTAEVTGSATIAGHQIHIGANALFKLDAKSQIVAAYVFGDKGTPAPATPAMDYYVFMKRDDSIAGEGTDFYFLHNGKEEKIHATADAVKAMTLQLDNSKDAKTVVTIEKDEDGNLKSVATIDTKYSKSFNCYTFSDDNSGKYFGYIADNTDNGQTFYYITDGCWIFNYEGTGTDLSKYVVGGVDKGDTVTVYFEYDTNAALPAGVDMNRVSLVVITHNA